MKIITRTNIPPMICLERKKKRRRVLTPIDKVRQLIAKAFQSNFFRVNHFLTCEKCSFPALLAVVRSTLRITKRPGRAAFYDRNPLIRSRGSARPREIYSGTSRSRVPCPCGRAYELELAIRLPLLPIRVLSGRHFRRFSDTFLLSRPATARCA